MLLEVYPHGGFKGVVLATSITCREAIAHTQVEVLVGRHVAKFQITHEVTGNCVVDVVGGL